MALRTRNAVLLAKVESTPGTEVSPSAATDAVLIEVSGNPISFSPNVINPNEVTGSLDTQGPIVGGMTAEISFDVYLKGSGTAGVAPEFGTLMRACGWAETLSAATVPAGGAEACGAGGSTTTAELGATAAATAQLYRGMPITFSVGVAGLSFITDYTAAKIATLADTMGGTINAGTSYLIEKNVRYQPGSTSIPALTLNLFMDGLKYVFVGCRGNVAINLAAGQAGKLSFRMTGLFASKTDAAVPAATYTTTRPPIWKGGVAKINRIASGMAALSIDSGNALVYPENPNATEGFDPAEITARNMSGNMDPLETLIATRDIMADFRAGTRRILHARYGSTVGNRVALTVPAAQYVNQQPGDRGGLMTVGVPFVPTGQDAGATLTLY